MGLERLGVWNGRARAYILPQADKAGAGKAGEDDPKAAVLLQARSGGRILGVLKP